MRTELDTKKENFKNNINSTCGSILERKSPFFLQHIKSSCEYCSVTIRKLRANVSPTLKNEELTGPNYCESEQLAVLEHCAYIFYLTLPVLMDLQSIYSRQLRAKLKLDSYKVFQAAEHGLLISQGKRKMMFFKPFMKNVIYFSILI